MSRTGIRTLRFASVRLWQRAFRAVLPAAAFGVLVQGCATAPQESPLTAEQRRLNVESFEYVWSTIRDKHFDPELGGLDWQAIHAELRPRIENAETARTARAVLRVMLSRLEQTHFNILPVDVYADMEKPAGEGSRDGSAGLDVRVIEGKALVTDVDESSPAAGAGVRNGWEIVQIDDEKLAPIIEKISGTYDASTELDIRLARAVTSRLGGKVGDHLQLEFRNDEGRSVRLDLELSQRKGHKVVLGNLGAHYIWFESRMLGHDVGYIAFNMFMDPVRVMGGVAKAMREFEGAGGIIIDLRGNPGGIGAMAGGIAGWFLSDEKRYLGTMSTRQNDLKFIVNPRINAFAGPVAILIDGLTGSTGEILSGGMKDLERARLFGARTAGAALPSVIERLPNGDGFQYAIANYVSAGGEVLEGNGVTPHVELRRTRESLLAGRDVVLDAAIEWIRQQVETTTTGTSDQESESVL